MGVTVESAKYVGRIDLLRNVPATVRFLSIEPMIGPVRNLDLQGIDWVIVGGESGPGSRTIMKDWVEDVRDQCLVEGVPFFFKNPGSWAATGLDPDCSGSYPPHDPQRAAFERRRHESVYIGNRTERR